MYRISRDGQEPIIDVDTVDQLEPAIRASKPGRYHVDQIERDPLPIGSHFATMGSRDQASGRFGCDSSPIRGKRDPALGFHRPGANIHTTSDARPRISTTVVTTSLNRLPWSVSSS